MSGQERVIAALDVRHDLRGADQLPRGGPRHSGAEPFRPAARGRAGPEPLAPIVQTVRQPEGEVTIAVVGKYTGLLDAYKSLDEALIHGGIANNVRVNLDWIDAEIFESDDAVQHLEHVDGILVPGGFGERGVEGKIAAVLRPRAQGALSRHLLRHADGGDRGGAASGRHPTPARPSSGRRRPGRRPDDGMGARQPDRDRARRRRSRRHHAAGRLSLPADPGSVSATSMASETISERHRHRYEVNINYVDSWSGGPALLRPVAGRPLARDRRAAGPSLVRRRAVPPGAQVEAAGPASAVRRFHPCRHRAEPAGINPPVFGQFQGGSTYD